MTENSYHLVWEEHQFVGQQTVHFISALECFVRYGQEFFVTGYRTVNNGLITPFLEWCHRQSGRPENLRRTERSLVFDSGRYCRRCVGTYHLPQMPWYLSVPYFVASELVAGQRLSATATYECIHQEIEDSATHSSW